jgi:hypothetical protein
MGDDSIDMVILHIDMGYLVTVLLRTCTRTEIGAWLTIRVDMLMQADAVTRFVDSTSVQCLFSMTLLTCPKP